MKQFIVAPKTAGPTFKELSRDNGGELDDKRVGDFPE